VPRGDERSTIIDPYRATWAQQQAPNPYRDGPAPGADAQHTCQNTADGGRTCYDTRPKATFMDMAALAIAGTVAIKEANRGRTTTMRNYNYNSYVGN
jgi:hypothetical protein